MLVAIFLTTWACAGLMTGQRATRDLMWLGMVLVAYAAIGFAKVHLLVPKSYEPWLSPVAGAATGVVTGATGIFVIPAAPYLQALGFNKDDLVKVLGLSFTTSTVALAAGLASRGAFQISEAASSTLCVVPALAGMMIGGMIRKRVNPATFRRLFLTGLMLLGADLIARSVV